MSSLLEAARGYIEALNNKNIDGALAHLTDDAVMDTPMGQQKGKGEIQKMLNMMSQMGRDTQTPAPVERDGQVFAELQTPMGAGKLVFGGAEKISTIKISIG